MSLDKNVQGWEVESVLENFLKGEEDPEEPLIVTMPGTNKKVGLKSLTELELRKCDEEARKYADENKIPYSLARSLDQEYASVYAAEVIAKALITPEEPYKSICSCGAELANKKKREQITWLFKQWVEWTIKNAPPEPNVLTVEQYEKLSAALKKNPNKTLLVEYGPDTLRNFILFLVNQQKTSIG